MATENRAWVLAFLYTVFTVPAISQVAGVSTMLTTNASSSGATVVTTTSSKAVINEVKVEQPVTETQFKYGFRYDPMKWAENDRSVQAAQIRTFLLKKPKLGDEGILQAEIERILATQDADGYLTDERIDQRTIATGLSVDALIALGCPSDREGFQRAVVAIEKSIDDGEDLSSYALKPMARLGRIKQPRVRAWASKMAKEAVEGLESAFGPGLPRTPDNEMQLLWLAREQIDGMADLKIMLSWVNDHVTPAATGVGLCPMWNLFADITATIEHPLSTSIAEKIVPTILRTQHADGSWGDRNVVVFATLVKHDLLDKLLDLPKLPRDWKETQSISLECRDPRHMAWDGTSLWVHDAGSSELVAISAKDGTATKTVALPNGLGVAGLVLWKGDLVLLATKPQPALYRIDRAAATVARVLSLPVLEGQAVSGITEVDGQLVVAEHWNGHVLRIDPDAPDQEHRLRTALGMPNFIAGHGKEMWGVDGISPAIIKTNLKGDFLDWGEKPFGNQDIAWDGKNLWALDNENKRICLIERLDTGD